MAMHHADAFVGHSVGRGGVAVAQAVDHPSLESLLKRSDRLLYEAKLAGRNRVMTDPPSPVHDLSAAAE